MNANVDFTKLTDAELAAFIAERDAQHKATAKAYHDAVAALNATPEKAARDAADAANAAFFQESGLAAAYREQRSRTDGERIQRAIDELKGFGVTGELDVPDRGTVWLGEDG
jgi:ABC-type nitrate/sulfonate/bicarbonate transport system substrate-binding protein